MATMYFDNNSAGAPALTIGDGTLVAILDWALVQNGWAIEFSSGHDRVYRAGAGKRLRLHVRDSAAASGNQISALVRGCEGATSATAITDPFPLVSQVSNNNCNWQKGDASSPSSPREWRMIVTDRFFWIAMKMYPVTDSWDIGLFGEVPASNAEDDWATIIAVRDQPSSTSGSSSGGYPILGTPISSAFHQTSEFYWARDITGATKSTHAGVGVSGSNFGSLPNSLSPRTGYGNQLNREQIAFHCNATQGPGYGTMRMLRRGWWPNAWNPLHLNNTGMVSDDYWTDAEYDPASLFKFISGFSSFSIIMEASDTWVAPVYG
jgi:hypothetical protein